MLTGHTILIADDNKLNQKILIFILEKAGAVVKSAATGSDAIEIFENNPVDVVLMDVQMPEMDGIEATQHIRNVLHSKVPIVGITANTMASEMQKCIDAGMDSCISKPFDPAALIELVTDLVQKNK